MGKAQVGELIAEYSINIEAIQVLVNTLSKMGDDLKSLGEALGRPADSVTLDTAQHQYKSIWTDKRGGRSEMIVDVNEVRLPKKLLAEYRDRRSRKREMETDLRNLGPRNLITR